MLTSPPPVQATTYGPAKPVVLRPYLTTKHRGTFVLGPPHHHLTATKALIGHYHHLIPVSPKHIHTGPPLVLIKSKPHPYPVIYAAHNAQTHKTPPPPTLYSPPTRKPQISPSNALSHPDITKAIFHPQPQDSYLAAAVALSSSQASATNPPAAYGFGTTAVLPQQYYVPLIPYTSVLGPQQRSDENGALQNSEDVAQDTDVDQEHDPEGELEEQSSPVLFYKGVRPPMKLYQEPQTPLIPVSSKQMELDKEATATGR
jgi:hypothetical protein